MSLIYQSDIFVNDSYNSSTSSSQQQQQRRSGLYLGSKVEAKNYNLLTKQWNVTHIINVTPCKRSGTIAGVQNYFESTTGSNLKYLRIPILDIPNDATEFLNHYSSKIISFISIGLHHGSVFVHCQRGISRSTTAVMFYLMRRVGMTFNNALELIKSRRPQAEPIPAFISILKQYEQQCIIDGAIIVSRPPDNAHDDDDVVTTGMSAAHDNVDRTDVQESFVSTTSTRKRRLIHEMNLTSDVNVQQVIIGPSLPNMSLSSVTGTCSSSIETSADPTMPSKTLQETSKAMIGPTRPPASNIDDSTKPSPNKKAIIGPTRPPGSNSDDSINLSPTRNAMIGHIRPHVSNSDDSINPSPTKKAMIGPTRPPVSNSDDSINPSPTKRAIIGPSCPPNI